MQFSKLILLLSALFAFSLLHAQEEEESSWLPGEFMKQATDDTFDKAQLMGSLSSLKFGKQLNMAAAIIEVGATIALDIELEEGVLYTFVGGGDEDVVDLDMYIVDESGNVVASDIQDDNTPIPDFKAAYSGKYSLRMQLVSGNAATSFVGFAILVKDGVELSEEDFAASSHAFFKSAQGLDKEYDSAKWHDLTNQWCLFGLELESGKKWEMSNLLFGDESLVLFAKSKNDSDILDLSLQDQNGKPIVADKAEDGNPVLEIQANSGSRYTLDIINRSKTKSTFFMVGILGI